MRPVAKASFPREEEADLATDARLARFWQPIETAASFLATLSPQEMTGALSDLVHLLAGDLVPRLHAEERVLLPLVSTERQACPPVGLDPAGVSRLAETLSTFALRLTDSDMGRVQLVASTLVTVLGEQRQAEAALVALIRALPAAGRDGPLLGDRLETEAQASRASQFFVSAAGRLPTEAWVLRKNPKPPRMGPIEHGRASPVADLIDVLEPEQAGPGPQGDKA
jgi:hypothetical protein